MIRKVDIISGFLGAGKTRFIKKLINDGFYSSKIAIVENEFGEVNIDSTILKKSNAMIKEITAGCICCEVTGYFKDALLELINKYDLDTIVIEPTGIAQLSEIMKTFDDPDIKKICTIDNLITIVDCLKFNVYMNNFKRFYTDQIKNAEIVVLSRTQLDDDKNIKSVKERIMKINPKAKIIDCNWDNVNMKDVMDKHLIMKENRNYILTDDLSKIKISRDIKINTNKLTLKKSNDSFQSFTLNMNRRISADELSSKFKFIISNNNFGTVIRAKGIVQLLNGQCGQFDFSLDEYNIENIDYNDQNIISFIGVNLNKKELEHFFK